MAVNIKRRIDILESQDLSLSFLDINPINVPVVITVYDENGYPQEPPEIPKFDTEEFVPLVIDPLDPARFASIQVSRTEVQTAVRQAVICTRNGNKSGYRLLMNRIMPMLFTKEELAVTRGTSGLDKTKVQAIIEFINTQAVIHGFHVMTNQQIMVMLQTKICNARRDLQIMQERKFKKQPMSFPEKQPMSFPDGNIH